MTIHSGGASIDRAVEARGQDDAADEQPRSHRAPSPRVRQVAAFSLASAGLSLAVYALLAFTTPDWTVAGPGLLIAIAGVAGMWNRWLHLAGLVPMSAIVSVAGPILAYDLARPDEIPYFVGSVLIIVGGSLAAVFGTASALTSHRRALPLSALAVLVSIPAVFAVVIGSNPSSAFAASGITSDERADAIDVEMFDVAYVADPSLLRHGGVVHLRNTGTLPHDFTIASLDIAVFVPPGRSTHLRLPASVDEGYTVVCTVGDHLEQGMRLTVTPAE